MNISNNTGTFNLTSSPILMLGVGMNTFTYQVTGSGTATIQGSNDGVNWFNIATSLTAPTSVVVIHSWIFLQATLTGTASILVSRA